MSVHKYDNLLIDLYFNTTRGYMGMNELYKTAKERDKKITYPIVKEWYDNQYVNQIYKKPQKIKSYNKIVSPYSQLGTVQADLMDISKLRGHNNAVKYLLNIVDIYSRYAWSFPITNKKPETIKPYIKEVVEDIRKQTKQPIKKFTFTFDNGREFMGVVKKYLEYEGVQIYLNNPKSIYSHNKMGVVERFNLTIRTLIKKYLTSNDTLKYIDVLPDLINNYNNKVHSATHRKPFDIFKNGKPQITFISHNDFEELHKDEPMEGKQENKLKIGDYVRSLKRRKTFDKRSYVPNYSLTVHQIAGIKNNRYILDNGKKYYKEHLLKVNKKDNYDEKSIKGYIKKIKKVENDDRATRRINQDFKMKEDEINKQIIPTERGTRERKQPARFINEY